MTALLYIVALLYFNQAYVDVFVMGGGDDGPLRPARTGQAGEICFGDGGAGFMARGVKCNA